MVTPTRTKQLAQIHIAKKELGLDDDTYRALLFDVAGVDSSSKLNESQRYAVLKRFKQKGWKNMGQKGKSANVAEWKKPLMSKIGALLADMNLPWEYANGIAKQMYQVARVDWCNDESQLRGIITALVKRQRKHDGEAQ